MGVSVSATLCFGFLVAEPEQEPRWPVSDSGDEELMDLDAVLAKMEGLMPPDDRMDESRYRNDSKYHEAWSKYWGKKDSLEKASGLSLVQYNHPNYPGYALVVRASERDADPYTPHNLGLSITAQSEWREQLRSFCERAGIEFREPQFMICCYWDG